VGREAQIGGDVMAGGGNFNRVLTIDAQGRVSPRGPLQLGPKETWSDIFAWLIQLNEDGTGAATIASFHDAAGLSARDREWTTTADAVHEGQFRAGPAIGMALAISKGMNGSTTVYSWSESLELEDEELVKPEGISEPVVEELRQELRTLRRENADLQRQIEMLSDRRTR
jgi:hypothetical protein